MPETPPDPNDKLTVAQVSAEFDVPEPTVYRHISGGELPAVRRGTRALRVYRGVARAFYEQPAHREATHDPDAGPPVLMVVNA